MASALDPSSVASPSSSPIHLFDRSRVTQDWKCPRARFLQYHLGGTGITSGMSSLELFMGTILHDSLAAIATQHLSGRVDIDFIAQTAQTMLCDALMTHAQEEHDADARRFAMEQSTLVEGLLRGFYRHQWPRLMTEVKAIRMIEPEVEYQYNGMIFMSKPDLVVEDHEGNLAYLEYKSTSSKGEKWINSWGTAVQLHSTCHAVEKTIGEQVASVIVQGLYKGFESYGKQSSPFCYAYGRGGNPPFIHGETRYDYAPGFKRIPTWELPGGVREWVNRMPENVLADQFPQTPPIFVRQTLVDHFFAQRDVREHEIKLAVQMIDQDPDNPEWVTPILDAVFPQHFDACAPAWGFGCQFKRICHGRVSKPLEEGFVAREPHHQREREAWAVGTGVSELEGG